MKLLLKPTLFLFLLLISNVGISQQYLWTSSANDFFVNSETKIISKEEVQNNLLKYYQVYDYY